MTFTFRDWNKQQKALRTALADVSAHAQAIDLALSQHGWTHQAQVSRVKVSTFADRLWDGLDDEIARAIPPKAEHSIAWNLYHLARIEDTAMNMLIAGTLPVFDQENWMQALGLTFSQSGNAMSDVEVEALSRTIDLDALCRYRAAVGKRTREIICALSAERLKKKVASESIQRIHQQDFIRPEAEEILKYWSNRTIDGLLLMPATRHNMVHLNECLRQKEKLIRSRK